MISTIEGNATTVSIVLFILLILVAALAIVILLYHIDKKHYDEVYHNSELLRELRKLNLSVHFYEDIDRYYEYTAWCDRKLTYDKFSVLHYFAEYIRDNLVETSRIVEHTEANCKTFLEYHEKCRTLYDSKHYVPRDKRDKYYIKIEKQIFEEELINPVIEFKFRVYKKYVSPAGRKYYYDYCDYDCKQVSLCIDTVRKEINEAIAYRSTIQFERARMTDSLRYDVMKRDGFRCQICGATQADGVKLHVDHIRPVSKGGKTVMSNLRTLCDRCNLGKSAKYDSYGKN